METIYKKASKVKMCINVHPQVADLLKAFCESGDYKMCDVVTAAIKEYIKNFGVELTPLHNEKEEK